MKRIFVIQSRTSPASIENEQKNYRRCMDGLAEIEFLSALDEMFSRVTVEEILDGVDGIIFGGSSDFDFHGGRSEDDPARIMSLMLLSRMKNLVTYSLAARVPMLGVCYGHQLIANMFGGEVSNDKEQSKFGSFNVELTEAGKSDPLFGMLPLKFVAQYAHKDSVTKLPTGATLLASSIGCRFSALRYGSNAYTMQFHPEVIRWNDLPLEYLDSPEASTIIPMWLERCVKISPKLQG